MQKAKQDILKNLENTYCRIRTSKINGVGVFAIKDIPKGINPFNKAKAQGWQKFKISELRFLDKENILTKESSELFDKARLQKGLSRMGLALEAEVAPQTINRLLQGKPTRPSNVKKVGETLDIPAQEWYIKEQ